MSKDIELLILKHLDGTATPEEVRKLDRALQTDERARRQLVLSAEIENALAYLLSARAQATEHEEDDSSSSPHTSLPLSVNSIRDFVERTKDRQPPAQRSRRVLVGRFAIVAAMAACLAIAFVAPRFTGSLTPESKTADGEALPGREGTRTAAASTDRGTEPAVTVPPIPLVPVAPPDRGPARELEAYLAKTGAQAERGTVTADQEVPAIAHGQPSLAPATLQAAARAPLLSLPSVLSVGGDVFLIREHVDESPERLAQARELSNGDCVAVGKKGNVVLRYRDGTLVRLEKNTRAFLRSDASDGKLVSLSQGALKAHVAPQHASNGMLFDTPHVKARILGTLLTLACTENTSGLEVREGSVALTLKSDGTTLVVDEGYHATANAGRVLAPKRGSLQPGTRDKHTIMHGDWLVSSRGKSGYHGATPQMFTKQSRLRYDEVSEDFSGNAFEWQTVAGTLRSADIGGRVSFVTRLTGPGEGLAITWRGRLSVDGNTITQGSFSSPIGDGAFTATRLHK